MQYNFQQDNLGDGGVSDSYPERLGATLNPYIQQSAPQVLISQGAAELSNVAGIGQMYSAIGTPGFPDQCEPQYEPEAPPTSDQFPPQAQSPEYAYHYWPMQYHAGGSMSWDTLAAQEPRAYAQQPRGSSSHASATLDVPQVQEGSVSSLVRKRSRRKERVTCPRDGCGREMSRDSLGRHNKEKHLGLKRKKTKRNEQD